MKRRLLLPVLALLVLACLTACAESSGRAQVSLDESRLHYDASQAAEQQTQTTGTATQADGETDSARRAQLTPLAAADLLGGSFEATRQALFSPPDWVRYEGDVSLWQYRGADCVLDAIFWRDESADLFATGDTGQDAGQGTGQGTGQETLQAAQEPTGGYQGSASPSRLHYLETRNPAGGPTDPNACLDALRSERAERRLAQ